MRIPFEVAGIPVEFRRNCFSGRAELLVGGEAVLLQSPLNPLSHFSLSLTRVWRQWVGDNEVLVEMVRPLLFAGFRPFVYRVFVDDQVTGRRDAGQYTRHRRSPPISGGSSQRVQS
jgi:hypothetical protein